MSDNSAIEWTDASWNPIRARNLKTGKIGWHCEHATTGCEFCYAEGFNLRLGTGLPFKPGHRADIEIFLDEKMLLAPVRWKRPRRIFVGSMTDLFADFVTDDMLDRIFHTMAVCSQHTFQVLTKRAQRMQSYRQKYGSEGFLSNVWLGASCERQQEADERIPLLMQTPAAVRFISAEPLLGPIDLNAIDVGGEIPLLRSALSGDGRRLDWVIVGGESGPYARPMHPDWARSLRDQCQAAGVAFFFKQHGEWAPFGFAGQDRGPSRPWKAWRQDHWGEYAGGPTGDTVARIGKKAAGRLLDGREHNDYPPVRA